MEDEEKDWVITISFTNMTRKQIEETYEEINNSTQYIIELKEIPKEEKK